MTAISQTQQTTNANGIIRANADALDWPRLPKPVKAILRGLRRDRDDAWRAWRAIADEKQVAWDAKQTVEARLKALTGGRADSTWYGGVQHARFEKLSDDDPLVVTEREKLEDVVADLNRLSPLLAERSHRLGQTDSLLRSVENYLNGLGSFPVIKLHKGPVPCP